MLLCRFFVSALIAASAQSPERSVAAIPSGPTGADERLPQRHAIFQISEARGTLSEAVEQLQKSFWIDKDRKKASRRIGQSADVFLKYLKNVSQNRAEFQPEDVKALTQAQLSSETLLLARRLRPDLDALVRGEYSAAVNVDRWKFLRKLEADLLHLKWLSSQLR